MMDLRKEEKAKQLGGSLLKGIKIWEFEQRLIMQIGSHFMHFQFR